MVVQVLSAGAGRGLVTACSDPFARDEGAAVETVFAAAGPLGEQLEAGRACDVFVSTAAEVDRWTMAGLLRTGTAARLGTVAAALATRAGEHVPDISTAAALGAALLAAPVLYLPDTQVSTAGRHIAAVLERLDLATTLASRIRSFSTGDAAMRALADDATPGALGCTQATEICHVPGLAFVGALPGDYGLVTIYVAAVAVGARSPDLAERFVAHLTASATARLRDHNGFGP